MSLIKSNFLEFNEGVLKSVKSVQNSMIFSKLHSYTLIPAN